MIILHNVHSKDSRDFIIEHGADNVVLDWYNGGRELFEEKSFHRGVSIFPSIVIDIPAHKLNIPIYSEPENPEDEREIIDYEIMDIAAHQLITRKVSSLEQIQEIMDKINIDLLASSDLGLDAEILTMDVISRSDEYYSDDTESEDN